MSQGLKEANRCLREACSKLEATKGLEFLETATRLHEDHPMYKQPLEECTIYELEPDWVLRPGLEDQQLTELLQQCSDKVGKGGLAELFRYLNRVRGFQSALQAELRDEHYGRQVLEAQEAARAAEAHLAAKEEENDQLKNQVAELKQQLEAASELQKEMFAAHQRARDRLQHLKGHVTGGERRRSEKGDPSRHLEVQEDRQRKRGGDQGGDGGKAVKKPKRV